MKEVERVLGALEEFKDNTVKRLDSIESKLDGLQGFRWRIVGAGMLASFVISIVVTLFAAKIH